MTGTGVDLSDGRETPRTVAYRLPSTIPAWLSLVSAGDMGVEHSDRRFRFLESLGGDRGRFFWPRQTHSRTVVVLEDCVGAGKVGPSAVGVGDAVIAARSDVVLGVTVADCLPVVFSAGEGDVFAAAHSGRRGTGIVADVIETFRRRYRVEAGELEVTIGPGIGVESYPVDQRTADEFAQAWGDRFVVTREGRRHIDLSGANADLCRRLGVGTVRLDPTCTYRDRRFASYRRDGKGFARMLACVGPMLSAGVPR